MMLPDLRPKAACQGKDPDLWFPEKGESSTEAIAICEGCPVRSECLEYAIEAGEAFGIWGGTTPAERRRMT